MRQSLAILFLVLLAGTALAQSGVAPYFRVDDYVVNGKNEANSAGDSIVVGIAYTGSNPYIPVGTMPDSVRIVAFASSDTLTGDFSVSKRPGGSYKTTSLGNWLWTLAVSDSIKKGAYVSIAVPQPWMDCDVMRVAFLSRSSGNSVVAANCLVYCRLERFFSASYRR